MQSRLKENESAILIKKYHIDDNIHGLTIDVVIQFYNITINGIIIDMENDKFNIDMPRNFCVSTCQDYETITFGDILDWIYIKEEIIKDLQKNKWIKYFFDN